MTTTTLEERDAQLDRYVALARRMSELRLVPAHDDESPGYTALLAVAADIDARLPDKPHPLAKCREEMAAIRRLLGLHLTLIDGGREK